MTFGQRIRQRREELKMNQAELAELLGYKNKMSISRIETGRADISLGKVPAFAMALKTTPGALTGWTECEAKAETIKIFYTFGSDERFPFRGGWVEIVAPSMRDAHAIFRKHYPDRTPGILNCSDYYTEQQFNESDMPITGNRGAFCHCKLSA